MERLRVVLLEDAFELVLRRDAHDDVEPQLGRVSGERIETVAVLAVLPGDDEQGVGTCPHGVLGRAAPAPENRQLGRVAKTARCVPDDHAFGAVGLRGPRLVGPVDFDDHRDAVASEIAWLNRLPPRSVKSEEDRIAYGTVDFVRASPALALAALVLLAPAVAISGTTRLDPIK